MTGRVGRLHGRAMRFSGSGALAPRALLLAVVVALGLGLVPVASAAAAVNPLLVSVPTDPNLAGATSVAISGHYAYTTAYSAGELTAVDFSNPAHPVVAGSSGPSSTLFNASTVNIAGGLAYVVSKNRNGPCQPGPIPLCGSGTNDDGTGNSLTILNVSTNPAVPQIVGHVTDATKLFGAYGVAVSGNYAYVAAQGCVPSPQPCPDPTVGNRFEVVDVSNPALPKIVASVTNPASGPLKNALWHPTSVAISNGFAYVTAFNSSQLTVINIANPLSPSIVASKLDPMITNPADVVVRGNYAYVANQATGGPITVVDVSNPSAPQVVGSVSNTLLSGAYRIRLQGNFVYVSGSSALSVTRIDIIDPINPVVAGSVTDATHLNVTTGLDVDPTGTYVIAASPYLASESNPRYPPYLPTPGAAPETGSISVILFTPQAPVPTALPSISGTAMLGNVLTASTGTWLGTPAPTFAYQWSDCDPGGANCKAIAGATSSAYTATANDVGARLEVTVGATNLVGSSQAQSLPTAAVTPRPGPPPPPPPAITNLRQSRKVWRAGTKLAHITAAAGKRSKKRRPVGTTFSFTLNEPASATFTFAEQSTGRKVKGVCRRKTAKNHQRPHCRLSAGAGTLVFAAHKGVDKVSFDGRVSHSRKLGPGRYTLALTATAAGKRSKARTISFTIVS